MTLYAFDAASPPSGSIGSALGAGLVYKAHGGIAANVYVSGNFAQDAAHVNGLRADGIAPWSNYEVGLWELVQDGDDYAAGVRAGTRGIADAIRCAFPSNGTIWFPFSIDVSLDPTRFWEAANAFRGIQSINAGRFCISCYGEGALISYLRSHGVIHEKGWLSSSTSFPGYDRNSPDICVWQEVGNFIPGHNTDRNVITDPYALKAWWPTDSPYIQKLESFMPGITDKQQVEMFQHIERLSFGFDNLTDTPFSARAEITTRLRAISNAMGGLASDADLKALVVDPISKAILALPGAGPGMGLSADEVAAIVDKTVRDALNNATLNVTPPK